jgi:hypothetical protein
MKSARIENRHLASRLPGVPGFGQAWEQLRCRRTSPSGFHDPRD